MVEAKYPKTLEAFKKGVKIARREIEDAEDLGKILSKFIELEDLLKDGRKRTGQEE